MPPRGRRDPALLAPMGDQGPEIELTAPEDETGPVEDSGEQSVPTLIYEGEILQTSMTLAVILPGDSKESYFGSRFVGRLQPDEDPENLIGRAVTVVREACVAQMDDAIDTLQEYAQQLAQSGRIPTS